MFEDRSVAYFSMEIALDAKIPTYSGGLGVLAGDTIRSAADLGVPMVAVSLIHRKGYFQQRIDPNGWQREEPVNWDVSATLDEMDARASVEVEGRTVYIRAWRYLVKGLQGFKVPVFFLGTDLPENSEWDRTLTHYLYGGDKRYRLLQEVVLGIGGVRMLSALGFTNIQRYHMNEGHASLLTLELLQQQMQEAGNGEIQDRHLETVRKACVFTTHTPVPAGHDKFPVDLARSVLGDHPVCRLQEQFCYDGELNMTHLAMNLSHYINGVAKRHGEVSREMFSSYVIDSITNGVHAPTWTSPPFRELFDRYIPSWQSDNFSLRYALDIPAEGIWEAHMKCKSELIGHINSTSNLDMNPETFTIGFARRAAAYKRAYLLFHDIEHLKKIHDEAGAIQIVYAGKAHPHDQGGKELIKAIYDVKHSLKDTIKITYLENYDVDLAKLLVAGVDVWLNTPEPPMEASGTSGMKAALNGIPSLSILDGWWLEGCIENITGWAINSDPRKTDRPKNARTHDAHSLYDKLEQAIVPTYYQDRNRYIDIMRHCIALNGSFFNTQRMVQEYVLKAYVRWSDAPKR